jgi:glycosyltransferase involved in cell wall biosynthesis
MENEVQQCAIESVRNVRIALVHEWLVVPAGSEQVLQQLIALYPHADVFCLVDNLADADRLRLGVGHPRTSFLQRIPGVQNFYRWLLPIMPNAIESLDLSAYDLVISNSHAVAKGARKRPGALHICHCCSPMRYAWDLREQYLEEAGLNHGVRGWLARKMLDRLKRWDTATSSGVDEFVSNSSFIGDRIRRAYGRSSTPIYSPVDTEFFTGGEGERGSGYVTASRFVPYKRMPAIVEAFRELPDRELIVIGDGPERERVRAAAGANVTLLGWQPRERMREEFRRARAFIFAAEEDFGIVPIEAQACGAPVIALGRGGSLETVIAAGASRTGDHFNEATPAGIAAAVREFESKPAPTAATCRANAEKFSEQRFRNEFSAFVSRTWELHMQAQSQQAALRPPAQQRGATRA